MINQVYQKYSSKRISAILRAKPILNTGRKIVNLNKWLETLSHLLSWTLSTHLPLHSHLSLNTKTIIFRAQLQDKIPKNLLFKQEAQSAILSPPVDMSSAVRVRARPADLVSNINQWNLILICNMLRKTYQIEADIRAINFTTWDQVTEYCISRTEVTTMASGKMTRWTASASSTTKTEP